MPPTLSKSTFLRGSQCKKSLYLNWHNPELKDPVSEMQQAIFSQGTEVGNWRNLFPGGIDAGIYVPDNYTRSIEMTSRLIEREQRSSMKQDFLPACFASWTSWSKT